MKLIKRKLLKDRFEKPRDCYDVKYSLYREKNEPRSCALNPMPNLDNLMQEWPPETEEKLSATAIPHPDLDCDLSVYTTIICNLFDIPVYESKMQSLHAFFSLYSTMKSTQNQLVQLETKK